MKDNMKIKILGTAAAEGVPSLFCNCDTCVKSREAGGRNIRSRSSILINEDLKVDLPPDTFYHSVIHNMDTSKIKHLLITHCHHDHFAYRELEYLRPGYAARNDLPNLQIYGTEHVINMVPEFKDLWLDQNTIVPFTSYDVGDYKITTLKAIHGSGPNPLNYIIQRDGKSFLYGCDTGYYEEETWAYLASSGIKLDLVISECTGGPTRVDYKYHMGLPNVCDLRMKFEEIGVITPDTKWIITHFSHNGGATYDEMVIVAEPKGFEVAYDGLELYL
jgi:phosphoribosyl 1,2-cyclic phosphate phosphodiesterase